jgi:DNA-binding CsgD family transcriptional regulator
MPIDRRDDVVSLIYDAAVDGGLWAEALKGIADLTNSQQILLQSYDGVGDHIAGFSPLTDPYWGLLWRQQFGAATAWRRKRMQFPVGQLFTIEDYISSEALAVLPAYRDWWRPQGMGTQILSANVLKDGPANAVLQIHKRKGEGFSRQDREAMAAVVGHVVRALAIHRRLHLAELGPRGAGDCAPEGFAILDRQGNILLAGEKTLLCLDAAGLLETNSRRASVRTPDRAVERCLASQAGSAGGTFSYRTAAGQRLRVTIVPVAEGAGDDGRWLATDRPAALLHIADPDSERRARIERLVRVHGLTPAEAAVALEISRGDGRRATAARLGIHETTVRSHLSAIFDKVGIHRQAELARLVAQT